jgi:hypothetical protein
VVLDLRHRWATGRTRLLFEPVELLERLAVLTSRPQINLLLYYGMLGTRFATARFHRSTCFVGPRATRSVSDAHRLGVLEPPGLLDTPHTICKRFNNALLAFKDHLLAIEQRGQLVQHQLGHEAANLREVVGRERSLVVRHRVRPQLWWPRGVASFTISRQQWWSSSGRAFVLLTGMEDEEDQEEEDDSSTMRSARSGARGMASMSRGSRGNGGRASASDRSRSSARRSAGGRRRFR